MDAITEPLSDLKCGNPAEMMLFLMKNPEHQERVFNLINVYSNLIAMNEKNKETETVETVVPGSNFITSEDIKTEDGQVKIHGETPVVMAPSILPFGKPAYAMNAINETKPSVPTVIPEALPAENDCHQTVSFIDMAEEKVSVNDFTIHASTDNTIPMETVSSSNIALSAAEISLCKKAKVCNNIVEPNKICSDQSEIQMSDANQLYTFCDRIISPEYIFCEAQNTQVVDEYFENSVAPSTCLSDHLVASPEYALPPKSTSIIPTDSEWNHKGEMSQMIGSPSSSICDESDSENDALESWNSLKDLQNFMKTVEFSLSPSSTTYDIDEETYKDIEWSPNSTYSVDLDDNVESIIAMTPEIVEYIDLTEDDNLNVELPYVDKMKMETEDPIPNCDGLELIKEPSVSIDIETPSLPMDDLCPKSLPNISVHRDNLLDKIVYQQSETTQQITNGPGHLAKRQKLDLSYSLPNERSYNDSAFQDHMGRGYSDTSNKLDVKDHPVFKRDNDGDMALHISVASEHMEYIYMLIQIMNGQELDAQNNLSQTPLHLACYTANTSSVTMLLQAGADPEIVDIDGNNIMHIACMNGSIEVIDLLMKYHLKDPCKIMRMLSTWNYDGYTPLHIACMKRDFGIIDSLLELNGNIDAKDMKTGTTSLVDAMKNHDWELARYLIENGASVNVPTNAGMYPLDYVALSDNLELAQELISRNAESGVKADFTDDQMKGLFESELRKRRRKRNRDARKD